MESASQWLHKTFKKYEQMGDRRDHGRYLENLANIHQMQEELHEAINKYNQALNMYFKNSSVIKMHRLPIACIIWALRILGNASSLEQFNVTRMH